MVGGASGEGGGGGGGREEEGRKAPVTLVREGEAGEGPNITCCLGKLNCRLYCEKGTKGIGRAQGPTLE